MSVSERRREGYPPEGPRPRSGLGRVARSRSDAPSLIVCIGEPLSIIGTIGICTIITDTGTGVTGIVVTIGFTSTSIVIIGIFGAGIVGAGIVGSSSVIAIVEWRNARLRTGRA